MITRLELLRDDVRLGAPVENVGDNVGDIAGMGADLFGSLAESTCACLVISGTSTELINQSGYYYPLIISATGLQE